MYRINSRASIKPNSASGKEFPAPKAFWQTRARVIPAARSQRQAQGLFTCNALANSIAGRQHMIRPKNSKNFYGFWRVETIRCRFPLLPLLSLLLSSPSPNAAAAASSSLFLILRRPDQPTRGLLSTRPGPMHRPRSNTEIRQKGEAEKTCERLEPSPGGGGGHSQANTSSRQRHT
jgi:hypothetical protein